MSPAPRSASAESFRSAGNIGAAKGFFVPMTDALRESRLETVRECFRRIDGGDPALTDLYTDDIEVWFPKYGTSRGKDGARRFAAVLGAKLSRLTHDIDDLQFIVEGDHVVVEGTESGETADGQVWPDGDISQGRFCNVYTFEGDLISRVNIYVDPDYTSSHIERIAELRPKLAD